MWINITSLQGDVDVSRVKCHNPTRTIDLFLFHKRFLHKENNSIKISPTAQSRVRKKAEYNTSDEHKLRQIWHVEGKNIDKLKCANGKHKAKK